MLRTALLAGFTQLVFRAADPTPSFFEPAFSPDRSEIVFASGGDLWTVNARGGDAHLLVSHAATESRPLYSPDGTKLAVVSTRTGNGNVLGSVVGERTAGKDSHLDEAVRGQLPQAKP